MADTKKKAADRPAAAAAAPAASPPACISTSPLAMSCCEGIISAHMVERGAHFSLVRCEESQKRLDNGFAVSVRGAARGGARELKHAEMPRRYTRSSALQVVGALLRDVRGSNDITIKTLAQVGEGLPLALDSIFTVTIGGGQLSVALAPTLHHALGDSPGVAVWSAMVVAPGSVRRDFVCPRSISASDFVVAYFSELLAHKGPVWHCRIFSIGDDNGMLLGVADGGPGRRVVYARGINCRCVDALDAMRRPSIMPGG